MVSPKEPYDASCLKVQSSRFTSQTSLINLSESLFRKHPIRHVVRVDLLVHSGPGNSAQMRTFALFVCSAHRRHSRCSIRRKSRAIPTTSAVLRIDRASGCGARSINALGILPTANTASGQRLATQNECRMTNLPQIRRVISDFADGLDRIHENLIRCTRGPDAI